MPARVRVHLELERPDLVKTQDLHYHVCRWLDVDDQSHKAASKPFAITPLFPAGGVAGFEIGLLGDNLLARLHSAIATDAGSEFAFGHSKGRVDPALGLELLEVQTWSELRDQSSAFASMSGAGGWRLHAQTPTFWRSRNRDLVEPRAGSILRGLLERWNRYAPMPLSSETASLGLSALPRVSIVRHEIEISAMSWRRTTRRGFVGTVDLALEDSNANGADAVGALLCLADFAGIGSMTPFGFGVARVEPMLTEAPLVAS